MTQRELAESAPRLSLLLLAGVFILAPLLPRSVHSSSGALVQAALAIAVALNLQVRGASLWRPLWRHPLGPPLALGTALSILSLLWTPYFDRSEAEVIRRLEVLALFVLLAGTLDARGRRVLLAVIGLVAVAVAAVAAAEHLGGYEDKLALLRSGELPGMLPEFRERMIHSLEQRRALAFYGNPNHLASHLAMVLPGFLAFALWTRRPLPRIAALAAAALLGTVIAFTQSRGGILMLLASGGLLAMLWLRGGRRMKTAAAAALFCVLVLGGGCRERMLQTKTLGTRGDYAAGALRLIERHPVLGSGADIFAIRYAQVRRPFGDETQYPHNLILQSAVETGAPGALAAFWLYASAGWLALRFAARRRDGIDPVRAGLLCALLGYLIHALLDTNNTIPALNHLFAAAAALAVPGSASPARELDAPRRPWLRLAGIGLTAAVLVYGSLLPYLARTRFETAVILEEEGRYPEALQYYSGAAALDPDNADMAFRLGLARLRLSPDLGLTTIRRATELNPEQGFLHDALAELLLRQHRLPEALAAIDRAIALHPARGSYQLRRALILDALGRTGDAAAARAAAERLSRPAPEIGG